MHKGHTGWCQCPTLDARKEEITTHQESMEPEHVGPWRGFSCIIYPCAVCPSRLTAVCLPPALLCFHAVNHHAARSGLWGPRGAHPRHAASIGQ